ncbi:TetR/AcrR family transcriptional regulator [Amycolatopsis sp. WQ 127309]|uniref:TetR/AcrR family transcriptional regulator n=1 Tax=Amycolatopsis sp. WQ 127309 TaxID=2932773 RepID=UPI001FF2C391|nr:TetR/AcrR family transcriptional regulator [Amycolatopsis sp. WQ 127309]UOZ03448.1 TetR/AcrR family transcriptional regulator [Amycolatopsis sp. WQ 127309]
MTTDRPAPARRLRADAEANLDRVLRAAEDVFAEHGIEASIELVAQRAGLGLGTIYRRFANKDALIAELVNRLLTDVVAVGERHLADPDGTGVAGYLIEVSGLLATSRGVVARLWSDPSSKDLIARSRRVQQQLVDEARRHGAARADLTGEDLAVALWAVHGILDVTRHLPVNAWRRHLDFVLAGLTDQPATAPHRPLSARKMTQIIRATPPASGGRRD